MGYKHSKESLIIILQNIADRLQKTSLSTEDVSPHLSLSSLRYHFGNLGNALVAAGLERTLPNTNFLNRLPTYSNEQLFSFLWDVEHFLGHEPKAAEYNVHGKTSCKPLSSRFGNWESVLVYYRKWKAESGQATIIAGPNDVIRNSTDWLEPPSKLNRPPIQRSSATQTTVKFDFKCTLGKPINFRSLRHAPINEQGVVLLFGMIGRDIGYYVESVQQGYPDCIALYQADPKRERWARVRIEFEFVASNFSHDATQCDLIVCWENDWPESPLPVIELSKEILKLPAI